MDLLHIKSFATARTRFYNSIKQAKEVVFRDYSHYDPDKCNNGGSYSFTVRYVKIKQDKWQIEHYSSSDFNYCPCCGRFYGTWDKCSCNGEFELADDTAVVRRLEKSLPQNLWNFEDHRYKEISEIIY